MLRALVLGLLLANAVFLVWTQGWLDAVVGVRARGDREPERLLRQVRPETVRILPAAAASAVSTAAPRALACLEAGPFGDAEVGAAQSAAQVALPAGSWINVKTEQPGTWIVYMGRYANREGLTRKEDEIKRRKLPYEEINEPAALAPGLSLGRFDERAAAAKALDQFTLQGVRTARIVELAAAASRHVLRVERAAAALAAQLLALKAEAFGKGFAPCEKAPGG